MAACLCSAWIIVEGLVYDVTAFVPQHPGELCLSGWVAQGGLAGLLRPSVLLPLLSPPLPPPSPPLLCRPCHCYHPWPTDRQLPACAPQAAPAASWLWLGPMPLPSSCASTATPPRRCAGLLRAWLGAGWGRAAMHSWALLWASAAEQARLPANPDSPCPFLPLVLPPVGHAAGLPDRRAGAHQLNASAPAQPAARLCSSAAHHLGVQRWQRRRGGAHQTANPLAHSSSGTCPEEPHSHFIPLRRFFSTCLSQPPSVALLHFIAICISAVLTAAHSAPRQCPLPANTFAKRGIRM